MKHLMKTILGLSIVALLALLISCQELINKAQEQGLIPNITAFETFSNNLAVTPQTVPDNVPQIIYYPKPPQGVTVTWTASPEGYISVTEGQEWGKILKRPAAGTQDVTLTAMLTKDTKTEKKTFTITIAAKTDPGTQTPSVDVLNILHTSLTVWPTTVLKETKKVFLIPPVPQGITAEWTASPEGFISVTEGQEWGTILKRPETEKQNVTLKVTLKKDGQSKTKDIQITILPVPTVPLGTITESLTVWPKEVAPETAKVSLYPSIPENIAISWTTSPEGYINTETGAQWGTILKRPEAGSQEQTVTLTAKLTRGTETETKNFPLTIKPLSSVPVPQPDPAAELQTLLDKTAVTPLSVETHTTTVEYFPKDVPEGVDRTWTASPEGYINTETGAQWGTVLKRPEAGSQEQTVTLKVTLKKDGVSKTKDFILTIKAQPSAPPPPPDPDAELQAWLDKTAVTPLSVETHTNTVEYFPKDVPEGVSLTWTAEPKGYINTETGAQWGTVLKRPAADSEAQTVTLTAILRKEEHSKTKTFTLTIKPEPPLPLAVLSGALQVQPLSVDEHTDTVAYFPKKMPQGVSLTWTASPGEYIDLTSDEQWGKILKRPAAGSQAQTVTLTAKLTRGTETETKNFTLTISPPAPVTPPPIPPEILLNGLSALLQVGPSDIDQNTSAVVSSVPDLPEGVSLTWTASPEGYIYLTPGAQWGKILKRPAAGSQAQTVTLTATLKKDGVSTTKQFGLTVHPEPPPAPLKPILDSLEVNPRNVYIDTGAVTLSSADIPQGVSLTWEASPQGYIDLTPGAQWGTILQRPASGVQNVSLTATLSNGTATRKKSFTIRIYQPPVPDTPAPTPLQKIVDSLEVNRKAVYAHTSYIRYFKLNIPKDVDLTWTASPEGYINTETGTQWGEILKRPDSEAQTVTLTAKLTRDSETRTKNFTITIFPHSVFPTAQDIAESFAVPDTVSDIIHLSEIPLPETKDYYGSSVEWTSADETIIKIENHSYEIKGKFYYDLVEKTVQLTAKVNYQGSQGIKTFDVTVKPITEVRHDWGDRILKYEFTKTGTGTEVITTITEKLTGRIERGSKNTITDIQTAPDGTKTALFTRTAEYENGKWISEAELIEEYKNRIRKANAVLDELKTFNPLRLCDFIRVFSFWNVPDMDDTTVFKILKDAPSPNPLKEYSYEQFTALSEAEQTGILKQFIDPLRDMLNQEVLDSTHADIRTYRFETSGNDIRFRANLLLDESKSWYEQRGSYHFYDNGPYPPPAGTVRYVQLEGRERGNKYDVVVEIQKIDAAGTHRSYENRNIPYTPNQAVIQATLTERRPNQGAGSVYVEVKNIVVLENGKKVSADIKIDDGESKTYVLEFKGWDFM